MKADYLYRIERDLQVRKYSQKTIKSYSSCLETYFEFKKEKLDQFEENSVKDFLYFLVERGRSGSTINLHLNAIKFFYKVGDIF